MPAGVGRLRGDDHVQRTAHCPCPPPLAAAAQERLTAAGGTLAAAVKMQGLALHAAHLQTSAIARTHGARAKARIGALRPVLRAMAERIKRSALADDLADDLRDAGERAALFLDVLPRRGDIFLEGLSGWRSLGADRRARALARIMTGG